MSVFSKAFEEVTVECSACQVEFQIARINTGCGLLFCDECDSEYDRASEDVFESALWQKAGRGRS